MAYSVRCFAEAPVDWLGGRGPMGGLYGLRGVCRDVLERLTIRGGGGGGKPPPSTPGVVKQDKSSGGSVDTTKTRSGPQRVRMSRGERPMGAARGKQPDTEALCHPPPPPFGPDSGRK